ncbi:hypothetical protein, partial [Dokdonia donghaensis]|uniref:hypothetical protein n=1 Tax=Dokdonia donghaensis TaxID=326320 RepID=UPI0035C84682
NLLSRNQVRYSVAPRGRFETIITCLFRGANIQSFYCYAQVKDKKNEIVFLYKSIVVVHSVFYIID